MASNGSLVVDLWLARPEVLKTDAYSEEVTGSAGAMQGMIGLQRRCTRWDLAIFSDCWERDWLRVLVMPLMEGWADEQFASEFLLMRMSSRKTSSQRVICRASWLQPQLVLLCSPSSLWLVLVRTLWPLLHHTDSVSILGTWAQHYLDISVSILGTWVQQYLDVRSAFLRELRHAG